MHRSQGRDHLIEIDALAEQSFIEDVLGLVKIGKEASVYCCRAGQAIDAELVAVKVYRGRQYRFKNDAVYQEARDRELGLRGRALRAVRNKSDFGREIQESTWKSREFEVLQRLHDYGADVPRPYAAIDNIVVMEYLGHEQEAASQLNRVRLDAAEAEPLFRRVMDNVEMMLACNLVHGDLSPHNVLYWQGQVMVIDFPQATDPRFNSHAEELLRRDIDNLCRYFEGCGVECNATAISDDLWRRFTYSEL